VEEIQHMWGVEKRCKSLVVVAVCSAL
jgi:hypothetical protein